MNIQYRYINEENQKKIKLIHILDDIGYQIFNRKNKPIEMDTVSSITILQLAHIGDFILTLPFLKLLKSKTNIELICVVSSTNFSLAKKCSFIDKVFVADAPYFARTQKTNYHLFFNQLSKIKTDLVFDLRGDIRNIFCAYMAIKSRYLVGFAEGGGGFLLTNRLQYSKEGHISNTYNALIKELKILDEPLQNWNFSDMPYEAYQGKLPENYLGIHISTGATARQWPIVNFIELAKKLSPKFPIVILGTKNDLTVQQYKEFSSIPGVTVLVGKTTLLEAIDIIRRSLFFIGLESAFIHIAVLLGKPVTGIYSGTTEDDRWYPFCLYPGQIKIIKKKPVCSKINGCGKLKCLNNICMTEISVMEVYQNILSRLNK
jgi:heptosyltransferase II